MRTQYYNLGKTHGMDDTRTLDDTLRFAEQINHVEARRAYMEGYNETASIVSRAA